MKKKVLALVLALVMTLTLLPVTAMAEETLAKPSIGIVSFNVLDDITGEKIIDVSYTITNPNATEMTYDIWWRIAGDGNSLIVTAKGDTVTVPANSTLSKEMTSTFDSDDIKAGRSLFDATQLRLHVRTVGSTDQSPDIAYNALRDAVKIQASIHSGCYVTLDNNDGLYNGSAENPVIFVDATKEYGSLYWVDKSLYSQVGYTFKGYARTPDATTAEHADDALKGVAWNPADPVTTWYAIWAPNQYTVTFNVNGGTGNMTNQTFVYDAAAQPLSANTFTRTGYTFMGWATTANGAVAYADNASVSNLATSGNVELYAVWTPNQVSTLPAQGAKYFVEHYVEKWDGSYKLVETEILSGEIGTIVTADSTKYDDNTHHVNTTASILNGEVTFDLSAADPMSSLLTLKVYYDITPYYPPVDPTPVIPSVDVDIHDDTLSDAAKAVGSAVKSGAADITPVAGYTKESIAQMQKDNALKLVVEKKDSYDPAEKSLIDKAAQEKGKAALVQFLEIDVTLRTMNDMIVAEVDDTVVPLTITVDLNAEMQKAAKESKTIYVARAHDGKVTFIEGTLNAEMTKFTFDSSKFSTYALVAFDNQTVTSPKTADAGILLAVSMSILSVTGSAVLLKKKED